MKAITAKNLEKKYILRQERRLLVREVAELILKPRIKTPDFFALKDISFEVEKGETFGIIGENGSGKSTLLKIISGVTRQSEGELEINGTLSALLELGAGFHPYLTGRENIYLNGSIIGLRKNQIKKIFDEIVDFAEIEEFIDVAVKNYSSGMFVRLGFAIAINLDPDILIIDEVLSVGDEAFQRKCFQKINEFKNMGKTIIIVTHDMNAVSSLCDRVMLLKRGKILKIGKVGGIVQFYLRSIGEKKGVAILSKGDLTLIFNNGKLNIFFKEIEVTRNYGGYSAIFAQGIWHESVKATWEINEYSENYIKCSGKFHSIPLKQIWEIKFHEESQFLIKISLEVLEKCVLDEIHISFLLSDSYMQWFSEIETGEFPDITSNDREWIHLNKKNYPSEFCGVKGFENNNLALPCIVVDYSNTTKNYISTILNSDCTLKSRVIQWLRIFTKTEKFFDTGIYDNFMTCTIKILQREEQIEKYLQKVNLQNKIQNDKIDIKFDSGCIDIFFEGRKITAGKGIYLSLLSSDSWHDSIQSISETQKKGDNQLSIKSKFRRLPIILTWEAKICQNNKIVIDFNLEILHELRLDYLSIILTLLPVYSGCRIGEQDLPFGEIQKSQAREEKLETLSLGKNSQIKIYPGNRIEKTIPKIHLEFLSFESNFYLENSEIDVIDNFRILKVNKALSCVANKSNTNIIHIGSITIEFLINT
ncbi:ABC transporter ATP-binding protein [bacterium]|nr:ABC transporter ATP-binding protein [bacterium]